MKKSNILKLLLAVICSLSLFVFAACSDGDTDNSSSSTSSSENNTSSSTSSSENNTSTSSSTTSSINSSSSSKEEDYIVSCDFDISNAKKVYLLNEEFSKNNIAATLNYKSGLKIPFAGTSSTFKYDLSQVNFNVAGQYNVIITVEGFNKELSIEVCNPASCEFDFSNVTKDYVINQKFNTEGMVVNAVLGQTKVQVESKNITVDSNSYKANAAGEYTINVSCYGFSDSFKVKVHTPTSVQFDFSKVRKIYNLNQAFVPGGATLKATVTGIEPFELDSTFINIESSNFNNTVAGRYEITASYLTFNEKYTAIVVTPPTAINNEVNFKVDASISNSLLGTTDNSGALLLDGPTNALDIMKTANYPETVIKNITFAPGTYTEKFYVDIPNVHLIGTNAETTKVGYGDCSSMAGGTDASSSIYVKSTGYGFSAKNITIENTYDYIHESYANEQAVAITIEADKGVFENCILLGYQDTLQVKLGRHVFNQCTIKGSVDFIFGGNPTVLFNKCNIVSIDRSSSSANCITAMKGNSGTKGDKVAKYGLVFLECNITSDDNVKTLLGRPWRADATVAYIKCSMDASIGKGSYEVLDDGQDRYTYMNGDGKNIPSNAHFAEYGNTGDGALNTATADFKLLTEQEANEYTVANIFATVNGDVTYADEWNPSAFVK